MSKIVNHVRGKMDKPTNEGTLDQILRNDGHGGSTWGNAASQEEIGAAVDQWMDENIPAGQAVAIDKTLTVENAAAGAKAAGDMVMVSQDEPEAASNKLWIHDQAESEYTVPTIDDFNEFSDDMSEIVEVSDDEPTSEFNKLWIDSDSGSEVTVPTIAEMNKVAGTVAPDYSKLTFPVAKGTLCRYEYDLYEAKVEIPSVEAWTSGHWSTKTNIADKLDSLSTALDAYPYAVYDPATNESGKWLDVSGVEHLQSGWDITDYLKIGESATYYIKTRVSSDNVKSCFYDSNKSFLSAFKTGTAGDNMLIPVENARFVRFSIQSSDVSDFKYSSLLFLEKIEGIAPEQIADSREIKSYRDEIISGGYYGSNGGIVSSENWSHTPLYAVNENDVVSVVNAQSLYAVLFDSSRTAVDSKTIENIPSSVSFTVPTNVKYIGLNIVNANLSGYSCTVNGITLGALYELPWLNVAAQNDSIWKNKTYISHGDSITWQDGHTWGSGSEQGQVARGYQTVFSESVGLNSYNNQGKSGWSMAVVNGNGVVNTIMSISDYSVYDLCTIACGTNDFKLNVPLGTQGVIGDTTFDDTTFYGAYRKAVEYILTNSPTIRLVLMTPLQRDNFGYDVNYTNSAGYKLIDYVNAVRNIGEMYGIPVCDMYANSGFTKKTLATYTLDGLHPNTIGYIRMGNYLTGFLNAVGN